MVGWGKGIKDESNFDWRRKWYRKENWVDDKVREF